MRNFKNLEIWRNGIELVKQVYEISNDLPITEKYNLSSQITRSAISIPSNIAEGCSRNSEIEFKRFLEIAIGSLFELETQIIIIQELSLVEISKINSILELILKEGKMINGLINKIKKA